MSTTECEYKCGCACADSLRQGRVEGDHLATKWPSTTLCMPRVLGRGGQRGKEKDSAHLVQPDTAAN